MAMEEHSRTRRVWLHWRLAKGPIVDWKEPPSNSEFDVDTHGVQKYFITSFVR